MLDGAPPEPPPHAPRLTGLRGTWNALRNLGLVSLGAPAVTRRLIEEFARRPTPPPEGPVELAELTAREREILTLIARGLTNSEIAGDLVLGESTVKTHIGNILSKLGLRDRVQAVVLAYETGLVRPGG